MHLMRHTPKLSNLELKTLTVLTAHLFVHTLRMGPLSWRAELHYARKATQGQTL